MLGVGTFAWLQRGNEAQILATAVGQQHTAVLADGSVVQLNTNTILDTDFSRAQRVVRIRKGEASFQVAHDPQRPFQVQAGRIVVRAVGTQFNVRVRDTRDVEVIVTEGKVDVTSASAVSRAAPATAGRPVLPAAATRLQAGQRYEAARRAVPVTQTIAPAELTKALAWREGVVVFDGEPLVQAVAEINRYSDTRLVVADAGLDGLRVGGRFRAGDVEGFLGALTRTFPISVRRSDDLVYLHERVGDGVRR
ncbi:Iron siderophore sensor protein [plant metagenome]|uniref:Iron siderophore sensor protein n=1 Tax=plant metagenome TaxID=1297885 RepID=A0A484S5X4_9ZZZZ